MEYDRFVALQLAREDAHVDGDVSTESVIDRAYEYAFFLEGLDPMTEEELEDIERQIEDEEAEATLIEIANQLGFDLEFPS